MALFEYDKRFQKFGKEFVFYDYKAPLDIPRDLRESFAVVFADPPFLSEECLTKTTVTVKFLAKEKILLCSGITLLLFSFPLGQNEFGPLGKSIAVKEKWVIPSWVLGTKYTK